MFIMAKNLRQTTEGGTTESSPEGGVAVTQESSLYDNNLTPGHHCPPRTMSKCLHGGRASHSEQCVVVTPALKCVDLK